jgi:hypothetical protein
MKGDDLLYRGERKEGFQPLLEIRCSRKAAMKWNSPGFCSLPARFKRWIQAVNFYPVHLKKVLLISFILMSNASFIMFVVAKNKFQFTAVFQALAEFNQAKSWIHSVDGVSDHSRIASSPGRSILTLPSSVETTHRSGI